MFCLSAAWGHMVVGRYMYVRTPENCTVITATFCVMSIYYLRPRVSLFKDGDTIKKNAKSKFFLYYLLFIIPICLYIFSGLCIRSFQKNFTFF